MVKEKITIIGLGSLGISLANILHKNGHEVMMYTHLEAQIEKIKTTRKDPDYFPNYIFPEEFKYTTNLNEAMNYGTYIILAVPSSVVRMVAQKINLCEFEPKIFISGIKGIEPDTFMYINEIVKENIDDQKIKELVVLTGPSHAEEMVESYFTGLVCGATQVEYAQEVKKLFENDFIRCEISNDVQGLEFAGSAKNAYAIGTGILNGIGQKDNAKAWFITKAFSEMNLLGTKLNINHSTMLGISGLGDLIVTCTSLNSRNFQLGYQIGKGENLTKALSKMTMTAEGVRAIESLKKIADREKIELEIIQKLYNIIFNNHNPKILIEK